VLRGMGKQKHATVGMFIGYYIVGLPLAIYLGIYLHIGVVGLWYGISTGVFFIGLSNQYLISYKFDWNDLVLEAVERSKKVKKSLKSLSVS
jgi:MATE family multidrug resistance protein